MTETETQIYLDGFPETGSSTIELIQNTPFRCHYLTRKGGPCSFRGKYKMSNAYYCQRHLVICYNSFHSSPALLSNYRFDDLKEFITPNSITTIDTSITETININEKKKKRKLPKTFQESIKPRYYSLLPFKTRKDKEKETQIYLSINNIYIIYYFLYKIKNDIDLEKTVEKLQQSFNRQLKKRSKKTYFKPLTDLEFSYILSNIYDMQYNFTPFIREQNQQQEKEEEEEETCSICLEDTIESIKFIETKCNHHFHTECIIKWFNKSNTTCPCCRKELIEFS